MKELELEGNRARSEIPGDNVSYSEEDEEKLPPQVKPRGINR